MNQKELEFQSEPFETERGTPTLTFDAGDHQRMIPYHSFISGLLTDGRIELSFQEGRLTVRGKGLDELWKELQLQDVRLLRCSKDSSQNDLCIEALLWEPAES